MDKSNHPTSSAFLCIRMYQQNMVQLRPMQPISFQHDVHPDLFYSVKYDSVMYINLCDFASLNKDRYGLRGFDKGDLCHGNVTWPTPRRASQKTALLLCAIQLRYGIFNSVYHIDEDMHPDLPWNKTHFTSLRAFTMVCNKMNITVEVRNPFPGGLYVSVPHKILKEALRKRRHSKWFKEHSKKSLFVVSYFKRRGWTPISLGTPHPIYHHSLETVYNAILRKARALQGVEVPDGAPRQFSISSLLKQCIKT